MRRCVVCLTDGSDVSVDGCPHVFCEGCIVQWCYYRQQTTCPTCRAPVREIRSLETREVLHEFIGPRTTSALICEKAFALKQRALKQCVEAAESMEAAESGAADARSDIGAADSSAYTWVWPPAGGSHREPRRQRAVHRPAASAEPGADAGAARGVGASGTCGGHAGRPTSCGG